MDFINQLHGFMPCLAAEPDKRLQGFLMEQEFITGPDLPDQMVIGGQLVNMLFTPLPRYDDRRQAAAEHRQVGNQTSQPAVAVKKGMDADKGNM